MQRQKILKQAKEKRDLARRLMREGKTGPQIIAAVKKKYKTGIGNNVLVDLRRELEETDPMASLAPEEPTRVDSVGDDLKVRLGGNFGWMQEEGVSRIAIDLDTRRVEVKRTEVLNLE